MKLWTLMIPKSGGYWTKMNANAPAALLIAGVGTVVPKMGVNALGRGR